MFKASDLARNLANPENAPPGKTSAKPNDDGEVWPSWRYGPDGGSKICADKKDVPKGWKEKPFPVKDSEEKVPLDL